MEIVTAPAMPVAAAADAPVRAATTIGGYTLPPPRRTLRHIYGIWFSGLLFFGYVPAYTYGKITWLLNDHQWAWTLLMYVTLVPLIGGVCVILLPSLWYRPIHNTLTRWWSGGAFDRSECVRVYERILHLPWQVAMWACAAALFGYVGGTLIVHWRSNQPVVEMIKTMPAIPLVGGLMGSFCYFGTARALHPVLAWCSVQLRHARPVRRVSLAAKFLMTTCVLSVAALCLLEPAAYRVGQVITEQHLLDATLSRLRVAARRAALFDRFEDQVRVLPEAQVGEHGYVLVAESDGHLLTPHPRGYTNLGEEQFFQTDFAQHTRDPDGVWVDRVGQHRVVAFVRLPEANRLLLSIAFPKDFSKPLHHFVEFSWLVILEVVFVVMLFGRYFTNGITTPLAELTRAARRVADVGDLSQHVPVTTNDELSEVARAFNRMVEELQASKAELEDYTKRLESSAQELSALNQEMEDLLRVVSHDLRAPLINIQGFSKRLDPVLQETLTTLNQLAERSAEADVRQQVASLKSAVQTKFAESLRFIAKGVEKMDALLSSLLAVSRVGRKADPIRPNDLDQILDDVLVTFDHQLKEHAIQVIRHPLPSGVPCRANEINQVFSNLVSNAINYMGPTGNRFIEVGGATRDDHLECYVRDTGIGIASDDQERIFQMFTRLQAIDVPGEGVGLAYVKKILRSHGGRIWVVSQKGQGSTFLFTLPLHPPAPMVSRPDTERAHGVSPEPTSERRG